jgi:glycosyltransferase involved in cell wall biosynthesis
VKILYIVSAFPRHESDLITPWMVETIRRLRARGVEVEVLAPAYRGCASGEVHGIRVHRFRYAPAWAETLTHDQTAPDRVRERPWLVSLVPGYVAAGSAAAARLARSGEFAAVHAFWPIPHGLLGIAAQAAGGVPLVTTFFGVELTWLERDMAPLRPVLRWIVRRSDAVTAISTYTANRLREASGSALVPDVIPFGAAAGGAAGQARTTRAPERPFEVLFVGRLVERKGVHVLLRAIAAMRSEGSMRVHVVGDGPERGRLESLSAALGVTDTVRFHGALPDAALAERFAACDAFVLPAVVDRKGDTEGLGVVLLEALSAGAPVIASEAGGITDIVRHGETGLLVAPDDPAALAGAIRRLRDDPALAASLARGGLAHVQREFSWETIVERLVGLYRRVATPGR